LAVSVGVMPAVKGPAREEGIAKLDEVYAGLKAKHWTEERQDFSYGWCSVMTPPASERTPRSCRMAEAKGNAVGVTYLDPKQKLEPAKAKALLDKIIGHM
jgi:hypothetical protein